MTRIIVALLVLSVTTACGSGQTAGGSPGEPVDDVAEPRAEAPDVDVEHVAEPRAEAPATDVDEAHVRWALVATPTELTMADRAGFVLRISATNEGAETVDPEQHVGDFRLGGQSHTGMNLWFGNGVRTTTWSALPPGETATNERTPGEHLFEAPGRYELSYVHGAASTSVTVTVTE